MTYEEMARVYAASKPNMNADDLRDAVEERLLEQGADDDEAARWAEVVAEERNASTIRSAPIGCGALLARSKDWNDVRSLIRSPFRFVSLNEKLAYPEHQNHPRNKPTTDGLCAQLTVEWLVETALLIGEDAEGENAPIVPMTLKDNTDYVIPGATLRGMVRVALQTVAFGRLWPINRHHRFGLRDFQHQFYKVNSPVSRSAEVRAGWMTQTTNSDGNVMHLLEPCAREGNDWAYIKIEDLPGAPRRLDWAKSERRGKYGRVNIQMDWRSEKAFRKTFSFSDAGHRSHEDHRSCVQLSGGERNGVLVFSGPGVGNTPNKEYEYVFFDDPEPTSFKIKQEAWERFELANTKVLKNRREPEGGWAELEPTLKNGGRIPVFYVGDPSKQDETFAFGVTRLFKISHWCSVNDLIGHIHRPENDYDKEKKTFKPDFVENLFGYVFEPKDLGWHRNDSQAASVELKGRVAFGFARPKDKEAFALWPAQQAQQTIQGSPKASFGPFYLSGCVKDWSRREARLAGRKRFVPRYPHPVRDNIIQEIQENLEAQVDAARNASNGREPPEKVKTRLRFLIPKAGQENKAVFQSEIRLHNVTLAELGAILWVLGFGGKHDTHRHMLGHAKPFGAGQVKLAAISARVKPNEKGKTLPEGDLLQNGNLYLKAFMDHMEKSIGKEWKESAQVQGYLRACNPEVWAEQEDRLGYPIFPNDFQDLRKATSWQAGKRDPRGPHGPWLNALRDVYNS